MRRQGERQCHSCERDGEPHTVEQTVECQHQKRRGTGSQQPRAEVRRGIIGAAVGGVNTGHKQQSETCGDDGPTGIAEQEIGARPGAPDEQEGGAAPQQSPIAGAGAQQHTGTSGQREARSRQQHPAQEARGFGPEGIAPAPDPQFIDGPGMEGRFAPAHEAEEHQEAGQWRQRRNAGLGPGQGNNRRHGRREQHQCGCGMRSLMDQQAQHHGRRRQSGEADAQWRRDGSRMAQIAAVFAKDSGAFVAEDGDQPEEVGEQADGPEIGQLERTGFEPQQRPTEGTGDRRVAQPPPGLAPQRGKGGGEDHQKIREKAPGGRVLRGDERRRRIGTDEAQGGNERTLPARQSQRPQAHQRQSGESRPRVDQAVKRVGRIDRGEQGCEASGRECCRNIARLLLGGCGGLAAHPFAGPGQRQARGEAQQHLQRGRDQAVVIGIFDEQQAADGDGDAADPHEPARRQRLLHVARRAGRRKFGGLGLPIGA